MKLSCMLWVEKSNVSRDVGVEHVMVVWTAGPLSSNMRPAPGTLGGSEMLLFIIFLGRPSLPFKEKRHFRLLTRHASQAPPLSSEEG